MESTHDYVLRNLERTKYRWPKVAEGSGVSYRTLAKIARREIRFPRSDKLEKLERYFRQSETSNT